MTTFRDSPPNAMPPDARDAAAGVPPFADAGELRDRPIGEILRRTKNLTDAQIEAILAHHRQHDVRFGEAAIALGLVTDQDVLFALSQQFHYPYAPGDRQTFSPELVVANKPFSTQAETFRAIRSQLIMRFFNGDGSNPALAVVSADSGDGKTYFAANLAVALSQLGGRTLLVDADLRGPRQHALFGIANDVGLSGLLSGRAEGSVIQQVADLPSLFVLPVGSVPPNPSELLERPAFGLLMREFTSKFDFVVVDTPAAVYGADASVIATRCGAALPIARKGRSKVGDLQEFVGLLSEMPVKLAGVIMNEF